MRSIARTIATCVCSVMFLGMALAASNVEGGAGSYQLDIPAQELTSALQSFALSSHQKFL